MHSGLIEELAAEAKARGKQPAGQQRSRWDRMLAELRGGRYVDLSKDTQYSDAWLILALLLTLLGTGLNQPFLLAAALVMLVVAAVGWVWGRLGLFGLHYRRQFSETRAFQGETVTLALEVRNQKLLPVTWLQITDIFPTALPDGQEKVKVNELTHLGEFTSFWTLAAFERLTRRFTILCSQRGHHVYGPAKLHTGDAFGMFGRLGTLPQRERLIVYPRIYTVAELGLPAKNPFGERAAVAPLIEDPLRTAGIREWQPADSQKRVHWKATARAPPDAQSRLRAERGAAGAHLPERRHDAAALAGQLSRS